MQFGYTEDQQMVRETVRQFAETELLPGATARDKSKEFPWDAWNKWRELGFTGMTIPEQYGGQPLDDISESIVIEELSRCDASFAVCMAVHAGLTGKTIVNWGSEEQKQKYLPKMASGEWIACYSLSEAGSGSDAASLKCRADKQGDKYIINGTKLWVTNGKIADLVVLFARTDQSAKPAKGISCFLVEKNTPGITVSKTEDKLGIRASDTAEMVYENVEVPAENLMGKENEGVKIAFNALDVSRIGIAAQALGIAQGAYECALKYANEREQFGQKILGFQAIGNYLAEMRTRIEASRLLVYKAAWMKEQGMKHTMESAMAKMYASETAVWVAERAVQILGGYGYTTDFPAERFFRDSKITTIYEGTNEIQRLVIARNLLAEIGIEG
ncbi:MAG: acyl-CoA dehydrogenase family protein [bacterium]|jgi:alkylation response protein AidB-like acyl-CoA dehydrogenase